MFSLLLKDSEKTLSTFEVHHEEDVPIHMCKKMDSYI